MNGKLILALIRRLVSGRQKEPKPPKVALRNELTQAELSRLLRKKFGRVAIFLSDRIYKTCTQSDIEEFLKFDETNKMGFVPETRDCDDFAYRLMGQFSTPEWSALAFGIVWTDKHAMNCFIDNNKEFHFIEPQTDRLQKDLKPWQGSKIRLIMM